jgi:hypothetical protein
MKKKKNSDPSVLNQLSANLYERSGPIIASCIVIGVVFFFFLKTRLPILTFQAEQQAVIDRLSTATNDTLLLTDEINHLPLLYFGRCVGAITDFYYGTDRSFDNVGSDFDSLFVDELNWRKYQVSSIYDSNDEKGAVYVSEVGSGYMPAEVRNELRHFLTIYVVKFSYTHPSRQACLG